MARTGTSDTASSISAKLNELPFAIHEKCVDKAAAAFREIARKLPHRLQVLAVTRTRGQE